MVWMNDQDLLAKLRWRYATKKFDAARKIAPATWSTLEESLVLTPSSYGLQPWRFVIVTDPAIRTQLLPNSWNQNQVVDCSHFVVFAIRRDLSVADIESFLNRTAEVRGVPVQSMDGYKKMMIGDLVQGARSRQINEWATRQAYIALGQFMASAAMLEIDTCPMEGINPVAYDEILNLPSRGFQTVVACAAGYRAADDKYAGLKKVRFARESVIEHR